MVGRKMNTSCKERLVRDARTMSPHTHTHCAVATRMLTASDV